MDESASKKRRMAKKTTLPTSTRLNTLCFLDLEHQHLGVELGKFCLKIFTYFLH